MTQDITTQIGEILASHQGREGALLPILHDIQATFGQVPEAALPQIAKGLNISKAEVHGVVSFYHDFRETRAGAHVVKLCRAEACQAVGADRVAAHAQAVLGVDWHGTTADGKVTLEPVYCLGLCACGPAALVDGKLMGRVDEARVDALVAGMH
ncbi:MAG: formate dehydrogenase subunit gamma [bacterium]